MKYDAYIHSIEPKSELKDAVRESVQTAIEAQNRIQIRKRHFMLSAAACFAVFAAFAACLYALNGNTIYDNNSTAETNSLGSSQEGQIIINAKSNDDKSGAQKIMIDGKVYHQYCNEDVKQGWGEDNGNVVIDEADIGDKICILDADNLVDDWASLSTLSGSAAESNRFYQAEAYQYIPCKNGTVLVVITPDSYYLFIFDSSFEILPAAAVIDLYTASGNNPVKQAVIYTKYHNITDGEVTETKASALKDAEKTDDIISILQKPHTDYTLQDIISMGYVKNNEVDYTVRFTFEDDTVLEVCVQEHYFFFDTYYSKNDYGWYELNDADFEALSAVIAE